MQISSLLEKNSSQNKNVKAFVIYVTSLKLNLIPIYLAQEAQIALLLIEEVQTLSKYLDFSNVFLDEKTLILSEVPKMNQHAIKLQEDQQSLYRLIYSMSLVKLQKLKTYIKINFANSLI